MCSHAYLLGTHSQASLVGGREVEEVKKGEMGEKLESCHVPLRLKVSYCVTKNLSACGFRHQTFIILASVSHKVKSSLAGASGSGLSGCN